MEEKKKLTMEERKAKGYLWGDTDEYLELQARAKDLMYDFNHSRPSEVEKRNELMKKIFGHIEEPVWIQQPMTLAVGKTVSIGQGTYINSGLMLVDDYNITIGEGCLLGTNVTLCTTGHPIHPEVRAQGGMYSFPITIGDNVWIGSNAVVLPGVTIGEGSVIGAGSVVTRDIPANVVAVGNPCRVLREITDEDRQYYYKKRRLDEQED